MLQVQKKCVHRQLFLSSNFESVQFVESSIDLPGIIWLWMSSISLDVIGLEDFFSKRVFLTKRIGQCDQKSYMSEIRLLVFIFVLPKCCRRSSPGTNVIKLFYGRKLRIFIIS